MESQSELVGLRSGTLDILSFTPNVGKLRMMIKRDFLYKAPETPP